ncbi:TPA: ATP-binding cassette domain-containing protein, partial [Candidatus Micrarchaeota archaeon]|nr:ATP-binding cassette domain-containing protein [Candidatus Micrarchaeota archaeon]
KMAAYTLSDDVARDRMEEILSLYPILKERLGQKAKTLSGGERQILALGMTLMRNPEIIMLDEPTGGLAPRIAREILQKIVDLRDSLKKTIILVEQNARSALEMGDNAILMVGGKLAFFGKAGDLLSDRELGKLYLGLR